MKHISHSVYKIVKAVSLTAHGLGLWAIAVCGIAVCVGGCVHVQCTGAVWCVRECGVLFFLESVGGLVVLYRIPAA